MLVLVDRGDYWQAGCVIRKGDFRRLREKGLTAFRESIAKMAPEFGGRLESLNDWSRISVLSVQSMRLSRWWRPGLLLIGDAAHVMSPIGGAGISLAIQDAVVTANEVAKPLGKRALEEAHLVSVQQRRLPAVLIVQSFQALVEKFLVSPALDERGRFLVPWLLRLPLVGALPTRLVGLGPWRVHAKA
jgi:2-polyprenyl-6-methoxyphenol hydroxylase-like FAD-dependent oxidoreductase